MLSGADLQGGLQPPLQLVHQWKYGEGDREEEVEERRKIEREEKEETSPSLNLVLHPPLNAVADNNQLGVV